jgi:septal ring-binding cell division protein DamX
MSGDGPPRCPSCGTPAERGQLVCLHCGHRLALGKTSSGRRGGGGGWRPAALVALALLALGGVALGVAIGLAAGGSGDDSAEEAANARADRLLVTVKQRQATIDQLQRRAKRRAAQAKKQRESVAGTWPAGVKAYTVVLVTASDEPSAQAIADEAKANGLDAGVLSSDDYGLGQGFWIVYSGRYDTTDEAAAEAANLSGQYSGAYPQLVDGQS